MNEQDKTLIVFSILSVIIGVLFIVFPDYIMNILFYIVGAILILFGLVHIIIHIKQHKNELDAYKPLIFFNVLLIILGVLFITLATFFVYVFVVLLGILFIIFGIFSFYTTYVDNSLTKSGKVFFFIIAIFDIAIGILLMVNLSGSVRWIMYILGGLLIFNGIFRIYICINNIKEKKLDNEGKKYRRRFKKKEVIDVDAKEIDE